LHYGDLTDFSNITSIIQETRPDEIYNLAAMSHVRDSYELSEYVGDIDGLGTLRILNAIKKIN
jgi:GDPmannose 4,6-dehydratase